MVDTLTGVTTEKPSQVDSTMGAAPMTSDEFRKMGLDEIRERFSPAEASRLSEALDAEEEQKKPQYEALGTQAADMIQQAGRHDLHDEWHSIGLLNPEYAAMSSAHFDTLIKIQDLQEKLEELQHDMGSFIGAIAYKQGYAAGCQAAQAKQGHTVTA